MKQKQNYEHNKKMYPLGGVERQDGNTEVGLSNLQMLKFSFISDEFTGAYERKKAIPGLL